jgi:hypothetical protein
MQLPRLHKILGLVLFLPLLAWTFTGLMFFLKPGYKEAYSRLEVRYYPLQHSSPIKRQHNWLEQRHIRTILGEHLIVKTEQGWRQLDIHTLEPRQSPSKENIKRLFEDAIADNTDRYGNLRRADKQAITHAGTYEAQTTTGVTLQLDWSTLQLSQSGRDTYLINTLYKLHYLQWSGISLIDKILGFLGLGALFLTTLAGFIMYWRNATSKDHAQKPP